MSDEVTNTEASKDTESVSKRHKADQQISDGKTFTQEDLNAIAIKTRMEEKRKYEGKLASIPTITPEVQAQLDQYAEIKKQAEAQKHDQLKEEGKFQEILDELKQKQEAELSQVKKAKDALKKRWISDKARASLQKTYLDNKGLKGPMGTVIDQVLSGNGAQRIDIDSDDKLIMVDTEGNKIPSEDGYLTPEQHLKNFMAKNDWCLEPTGSPGSGFAGSSNGKQNQSAIKAILEQTPKTKEEVQKQIAAMEASGISLE